MPRPALIPAQILALFLVLILALPGRAQAPATEPVRIVNRTGVEAAALLAGVARRSGCRRLVVADLARSDLELGRLGSAVEGVRLQGRETAHYLNHCPER